MLGVDGVSDLNAPHSRKCDHEVPLHAFNVLALGGDDLRSLRKTNPSNARCGGAPDVGALRKGNQAPFFCAALDDSGIGACSRFHGCSAGACCAAWFSSDGGLLRRARPIIPMTIIKVPTITRKSPAVGETVRNSSNAMAASITATDCSRAHRG